MEPALPESWVPDEYLMALGRLAIEWASLEQFIDGLCVVAFNQLGGRQQLNEPLPRSFGRKVRFLRKAFTKLAALSRWKKEALALLTSLPVLSAQRHRLIHAAPYAWDEGGNVSLVKFRYEETDFYTDRSQASAAEIETLRKKIRTQSGRWMPICNGVLRVVFPNYFEKADGKFAR